MTGIYNPITKDINRLITSLHPTGKIIFQTDMENELIANWAVSGDTGASADIFATQGFRGGKCLRIITPATANTYCSASRFMGLPFSKRIGLELWLNFFAQSNLKDFSLQLTYYREGAVGSVTEYMAVLKFLVTTFNATYNNILGKWQYYDDTGNYVDLPNGTQYLYGSSKAWTNFKLIADFDKQKYVKLFAASKVFDLSSLKCGISSIQNEPNILSSTLIVETAAAAAVELYSDDWIITQDEP